MTQKGRTFYFSCESLILRFGEESCCTECHKEEIQYGLGGFQNSLFEHEKEVTINGETINFIVIFCCKRLHPVTIHDWYDLYKIKKKAEDSHKSTNYLPVRVEQK